MLGNPTLFHQAKSIEKNIEKKDKYWQKLFKKSLNTDKIN